MPAFASPDRINGGEFVVGLDPLASMTVNFYSGGQSFCTGVLIERDVVLTAAHCLGEQLSSIGIEIFGEWPERRVRVRAKNFRAHPGFQGRNELYQLELHDIAVWNWWLMEIGTV